MKKPAVRLWLVAALLIAAGVVGRVVLHAAAPAGPGYIYIIVFQQGFYGLGLLVLGVWVWRIHDDLRMMAAVVWLATAAVCSFLTCGSSPR